jgi:taurine dioxygenase
MAVVYDCLRPDLKKRVDEMTAVHDWYDNFGLTMSPEDRERLRPDFPPVEHPVVRTHPETGRRTLFVNRFYTQRIMGLDPDESDRLLDLLFFQTTFPEYPCRWRWRTGDVVFWDNRALQHYASSDYYPNRRANAKVLIAGDRPY